MTDILYIIVSSFTFPLFACISFYLWLFKKTLFFGLNLLYRGRIEYLVNPDIYWAIGEKYHNLINVTMFLNGKQGEYDIVKDTKKVIQEKLLNHQDRFSKMMCSLHTIFGYPFLLREKVSIEEVITVIDPEKEKYKSMNDLMFVYSNKPMPRDDTLLWEIIILMASKQWKHDNNIKENQIPMLIRINHTVADGLSVMNFVATVLGENEINLENSLKNIPKSPAWTLFPPVKNSWNLFLFFLVPGYLIVDYFKKEIIQFDGPYACNRQNIAYRSEKVGENLVQSIKKLKTELGDTSFSEILLTAISGSAYNYFRNNFYKVPESINLAVVATKDLQPLTVKGKPVLRNQFGMLTLKIPIKLQSNSMLDRLEALKKNTRELMKNPGLDIRNYITFNLLQYMPLPLIKRLLPIKNVWSVISNLPEFPKMKIFNGYEVEDAFFYTIQRDQMANGFSVISYDKRIHLGLTADVASVPTKENADQIVNDFFDNLELLKQEVEQKKLRIN